MKTILSQSAPDGRNVVERGDILVFSGQGLKPAEEICAAARAAATAHGTPSAEILQQFSVHALEFMANIFPDYARAWQVEPASFRVAVPSAAPLPVGIELLPGRALFGSLILRCSVNVDPTESFHWVAADPFLRLARREAENAGLQAFANATTSPLHQLRRRMTRYLQKAGVRVIDRSPFDAFMEHFSRWMKANDDWRKRTKEYSFEFPPGATWIVFTDVVPHAVVKGGIALEQTVIVPRECMANASMAPAAVLERLAGCSLTA